MGSAVEQLRRRCMTWEHQLQPDQYVMQPCPTLAMDSSLCKVRDMRLVGPLQLCAQPFLDHGPVWWKKKFSTHQQTGSSASSNPKGKLLQLLEHSHYYPVEKQTPLADCRMLWLEASSQATRKQVHSSPIWRWSTLCIDRRALPLVPQGELPNHSALVRRGSREDFFWLATGWWGQGAPWSQCPDTNQEKHPWTNDSCLEAGRGADLAWLEAAMLQHCGLAFKVLRPSNGPWPRSWEPPPYSTQISTLH